MMQSAALANGNSDGEVVVGTRFSGVKSSENSCRIIGVVHRIRPRYINSRAYNYMHRKSQG